MRKMALEGSASTSVQIVNALSAKLLSQSTKRERQRSEEFQKSVAGFAPGKKHSDSCELQNAAQNAAITCLLFLVGMAAEG